MPYVLEFKNTPSVTLIGETLKRLQDQDCQLVSTTELNALMSALEAEIINRMAAYETYPEIINGD